MVNGKLSRKERWLLMTVASVTEISAASPESFEAAIREGIERANKTLRNIQSAWVKDRNVLIEDGQIRAYKVNLLVTFVLEDAS
jgi:flavin-binding protein dodecin